MLVLSRVQGEQIIIGDEITITILKIQRNQVKIGIEAPRTTTILRGELLDNIPPPATPSSDDEQES